jgi:hypothetical protein
VARRAVREDRPADADASTRRLTAINLEKEPRREAGLFFVQKKIATEREA